MSFTLHIVGVSATAPVPSSAASGYLLAGPDGSVLVDCGPGIVLELARQRLLDDVVAVVVTHRHADHALDLGALAYRLQFPSPRSAPVPLYLPAESLDFVAQFDSLIGIATVPTLQAPLAQAFDVRGLNLDSTEPFEVIPGLQLTAFAAHHAVPSASLRFEDIVTGGIVAFSSDTSECSGVRAAAAGADLFVCEATYLTATVAELEGHGHLTGEGAGRLAAEAGVGTLLVSHIADQALAPRILADAAQTAGGDVTAVLARPGDRYPLTRRVAALTLRPH
ncbi:MBL fold metallo-hydrolase [Cryobacterium sinapicolor]|uniref:MBL fold metallo-hydrolase n=1 Tax=Cryobacterium sinapicolor TaxID=1259236 RepID=A0ABY2IXG9_9MICO|nr:MULTISPECIES: MBL fold metallo-hydrolase [Cryobacterium]TFC84259.1 MBL fold metallo-hydrolase [Cryobacterium sp. TMT3-29-2]TFC95084.1 MBL fold metallo-hydrolase [Cryobacterium sinapicolor]